MELLRAVEPLRVGDHVLVPVVRGSATRASWPGAAGVAVRVAPHALVVGDGRWWRALAVGGGDVPLDELLAEVPGLAELVGGEASR